MTASTRRYRFSASHRLHTPELSAADNARIYGKCNNPFGHGHDYVLSITVAGPADPETGLAVKRSELDRLANDRIVAAFANRNFNADVPQFAALVPTTENIARIIACELERFWPDYISNAARLIRVHVQETDRNGFEILVGAHAGVERGEQEHEHVKFDSQAEEQTRSS